MDRYEAFDNAIFEITKIQVGPTLTEGQKRELLEVAGEIETAFQRGTLTAQERRDLLDSIEDCGLELPAGPGTPARQQSKGKHRETGRER